MCIYSFKRQFIPYFLIYFFFILLIYLVIDPFFLMSSLSKDALGACFSGASKVSQRSLACFLLKPKAFRPRKRRVRGRGLGHTDQLLPFQLADAFHDALHQQEQVLDSRKDIVFSSELKKGHGKTMENHEKP